MLDNKIYDVLKWVAMIALPALATLVSVVLPLWNICDESMVTKIRNSVRRCSSK